MTAVSGLGPWAGTDVLEAQTAVMGELTSTPTGVDGLPFLVQLAARGYGAEPTGRGAALLAELPAELGPHGWKLADRPGRDCLRAAALLREDVDALAVAAYGYAGPLVAAVTGPFTLAAHLYLARGDRVLSDPGAVRELTESLAVGVADHLAALRVAVPGAEPTLVLDESTLAEVLLGRRPTFAGNSVLRAVPAGVVSEQLRLVAEAARAAGATRVVVHTGESWIPVRSVVAAGADAIALAVDGFNERGWDRIAEAVERGVGLWAGLPAAVVAEAGVGAAARAGRSRGTGSDLGGPDVVGQAGALLGPWGRLGLPPARLRDVVVVAGPSADATPDSARAGLADVIRATELIAERAEDG
ncbi:uroporphyrinogen decarboxylase/cobalamine-independent methonine synthase family protein [Pengzhenrongella sicca]|uniref:Methionine synthase n=1 Tax=Pengzhenrongella sicca TaxID=2819238 RepID=A0A8A4ZDU0_9MICO|nr:hypothetical protein [Pengzhenrongella sicca]QTE28716.1 hypothetical protein J4E96_15390 [Pengzhenrongella sicca]